MGCLPTNYRWTGNEKTAKANQGFDEQSTHRCVSGYFVHDHSRKLQIPLNHFHLRKYVFSRRNCDPSGFLMTMHGSPYHISQVTSHNPAYLRKARLGGRGTVKLAAANNWAEESCRCIWLFIIRHPLMNIDHVDRRPKEWGPQWAVAMLVWPGTWLTMVSIGCRDPPKNISYFCLW